MRTQKNTAKLVVVIICIFMISSLAVGEQTVWDCPECGRTGNTGNYCGGCAHPAPWINTPVIRDPSVPSTPKPNQHSSASDSAVVGEIVQFGHYEQDGNKTNGTEPIEWYVLACDEQGILLISLFSLDSQPYNTSNSAVNWGSCSLRKWLNSDFYDAAFSAEEKVHIIDSHVSPAKDMSSRSETILDQGSETIDKVFLLSRDEWLDKYRNVLWNQKNDSKEFKTGMIPMSAPKTTQAIKNAGGNDRDEWWLRGEVHDKESNYPYSVIDVCDGYCPVRSPLTQTGYGIRPLLRIDSIDAINQNPVASPLSYYPTPTPTTAPLIDSLSSITERDVGSTIRFGSYEQDNISSNGKEPIEWVILSVKGSKALLISKKGLDAQPYNTTYSDVTWEKCTLRTWLNEDFYASAFATDERACVVLTEIDNSSTQDLTNHSNKGGKNTKDKVFLLSNKEAIEDYKTILQLNPCESTEYAKAQGAYTFNGYFGWKLRTPWLSNNYGLLEVQESDGRLYVVVNERSDNISGAIRPAVWIDLSLVP